MVFEPTELKFDFRCDLQGHFEVAMASAEATNMAVRANMQMDFRVIGVLDYKYI